MKKLFLVCLMMLAGSAWAEWVEFFRVESMSYYFDPATIRKDGNMRRVWRLQDLKQRDANGELSRRFRLEYDCKEERYKFLFASTHSERMAGGETLFSADLGEGSWREIPPSSAAEAMLKIVCSK